MKRARGGRAAVGVAASLALVSVAALAGGPLVGPDGASVAAPATAAAGDDPLVVQVLTFGPGDHPFTRFGHNAIRIVHRPSQTDLVYNFGTFSFDSPLLIVDFLQGKLQYWLSRATYATVLRTYQRENRDIEVQELRLSRAQKLELSRRLEVNALPENRRYRYDYFADNCSTRVRDALDSDGVLAGRLHAAAGGPARMSLRAHALRMAADNLPLYVALSIVLGPRTDGAIDRWAETFLPEELQGLLREITVGDGAGKEMPAGLAGARPVGGEGSAPARLVQAERVPWKAARAPAPREPPRRWPGFLAVGLAAGVILVGFGWAASRSLLARIGFGLVVSATGLVLGGVGCFLVLAWALTPHVVVYGNQNSLLFAPFAVTLAVLGIGASLGRPGAIRKTARLATLALALAGVACAIKVLPVARQDNAALIVMMLPVWAGLAAGTRLLRATRATGATHVTRATRATIDRRAG